jgi:hypothetical protein
LHLFSQSSNFLIIYIVNETFFGDVKMDTVTKNEAKEMVEDYKGGQIFTVTFVKRSTGETRMMNCRKGVRKGVSGEGLKFSPCSKGLVNVYDVQNKGHRFISLENIKSISMRGKKYIVK